MRLKICLVKYDDRSWATSHRAEALEKRLKKTDDVETIGNISFRDNVDEYVGKFDIIHILYSGGLAQYLYPIFKKYPKRFITCVASHRTLEEWWDDKEQIRFVYENSAAVIAFNKKLQKMVPGSVYIPNGVEEGLFKPGRKFAVGFVGIRDKYKGFYLIEEACKRLGVRLLHDGNEYPEKVRSFPEMPKLYKKFDCLCIASENEGCHNPTLEALAMNIPVVSTDTGIASELEGVILVERSVEGIMAGIREVWTRRQILEKYTWDKITEQHREVYKKVYKELYGADPN